MYTLAFAKTADAELCYQIIDEGRRFQKEQGFVQWTDDYPNIDTIHSDIAANIGYVLKTDNNIAGYMCIDFSGEPAYVNIDGAWRSAQPYAVVHRMAFSRTFQGTGLANTAFTLIEALCRDKNIPYIRVDTDPANKRMQHILTKNGFSHCGSITFQGGEKLAYDKLLL